MKKLRSTSKNREEVFVYVSANVRTYFQPIQKSFTFDNRLIFRSVTDHILESVCMHKDDETCQVVKPITDYTLNSNEWTRNGQDFRFVVLKMGSLYHTCPIWFSHTMFSLFNQN